MTTIKQIMTSPVVSITPNALVEDALDLMLQHSISGMPVVDDDGQVIGMISEFDTLMLLNEPREDFRIIEPVDQFMTTPVEVIGEDESIENAAEQFRRQSVRRLPVTREGQLLGIVSRRDLIRLIREQRCRHALASWDHENPLSIRAGGRGGK